MQRKIKCAKSTISAIQGTKKSQSQAPVIQRPRASLEICKEEWNFSDGEHDHVLAEALMSHFDQSSRPKVDDVVKSKDENIFQSAHRNGGKTKIEPQGEESISPQFISSPEGHQDYEQELANGMEDFINLTARFHENFKHSDDDLLNHVWSPYQQENAIFDDTTGLNQPRRVGACSLHTAEFDSSPIPLSKMASLKDRRIPKTHPPLSKKNMVKDPDTISQFMKKRETGWRE